MAHDGTLCVGEEGNTSPPPNKALTRVNPSRYWCFTVYNMSVNDVIAVLERGTRYVIGEEICPSTGKLHLQCFLISEKRIRPLEKYAALKAHWERMKGTVRQAAEYCMKDGKYVEKGLGEYVEFWSVDEVVQEVLKLKRKKVLPFLYNSMFVTKKIKLLKGEKQQKEYCQMIMDLAYPEKSFNWDDSCPVSTGMVDLSLLNL